jgi:hypothetical protein
MKRESTPQARRVSPQELKPSLPTPTESFKPLMKSERAAHGGQPMTLHPRQTGGA